MEINDVGGDLENVDLWIGYRDLTYPCASKCRLYNMTSLFSSIQLWMYLLNLESWETDSINDPQTTLLINYDVKLLTHTMRKVIFETFIHQPLFWTAQVD